MLINNPQATLINWLLLICLILFWGTSFMFTAIAVETVDPVSIVFFRVLIGALILTIAVYARGLRLPLTLKAWLIFILFGAVGNLLPFFLIAWGQQSIDSGIAGMIMAIMPLITMILAHYFVAGETLNRYKISGFLLGISGISILLGPVFEGSSQAILSGIAIFIAASSYAANSILVRRLPRFDPLIAGAGVLIAASITMLPIWLLEHHNDFTQMSLSSLASVAWLGIGPTGIATIILFSVIERAGPTFLSTINYLIPVVAFFCGVLILSEPVNSSSIIALVIILCGIALTRYSSSQIVRS
ncbi:MAG: DMT family transporter [Gammaproteobacteria bacterium]|jgi:drug/metabolite transporter (DMT)-like permease|nr:DMT family transporter [Gammaproteobacteria bacterium]MBT3724353.1 DMT family transporter [Gammaproteobacteria bacterium]MBT4077083.1 DMT family transporter [Gammaproteobacteria bacterium]MBT4194038.1 DMT family transporter [Gammaproteobacteria bacterium]MBT4452057.1 DMT family transporter [Gammaproteobacteria bacterium]